MLSVFSNYLNTFKKCNLYDKYINNYKMLRKYS